MQQFARLFAYATWGLMISLGAILFTHLLFPYMHDSLTVLVLVLVGTGVIYFNLIFTVIKRYIRKVPAPTNSHYILAILMIIPPLFWILVINESITLYDLLVLLVLGLSAAAGILYGNRAGIKARYEFVQKLKEYQKRMAGS